MKSILLVKYLHVFLIFFATRNLGVQGNTNNKGDETDVIIKQIMNGYEKDTHPNSDAPNGAVTVRVGLTPLAIEMVRKTFKNRKFETSFYNFFFWLTLG